MVFFKDKKILIIGGTGTIGESLVRHILMEEPSLIRVFSRDEFKQYQMQKELGDNNKLEFILGDVRDYQVLKNTMNGIDYVFHLAAMKQVTACEFNPYEAVKTNIYGTTNVINTAIEQKVKKVLFTSSDKAISPTNTYGATKLIGERLITSVELNKAVTNPIFASVRFGNVMGSRGSVIPLFQKQIQNEKNITLTDRNMTRFMMTLEQATSLTIKALKEAKGGEVFVLKMPVIKLDDLASVLIEETCKKYGIEEKEIGIEVMGLRPGEKMYEELMTYDESLSAIELKDMYIIVEGARNDVFYAGSKKITPGTYSSKEQDAISKEQLRRLLREANLT